jgi:5-methylcytosine-specific restriction endonuclease McrA
VGGLLLPKNMIHETIRDAGKASGEKRSELLSKARAKFGGHGYKQWNLLKEEFNYRCVRCGTTGPLERDHVIPVYMGGNDTIENIQPLCRLCNTSKKSETYNWKQHRRNYAVESAYK